jgi:hypothetical protein
VTTPNDTPRDVTPAEALALAARHRRLTLPGTGRRFSAHIATGESGAHWLEFRPAEAGTLTDATDHEKTVARALAFAASGDALAAAVESLAAQVERYRALLLDVAWSGVEDDDPRTKYRTVQIDRDTWHEVRALAEEAGR